MTAQQKKVDSFKIAQQVVEALQEKKGIDITLLDLRHIGNSISDYFIICSGNSDTQIGALTDSVEKDLKEKFGQTPWKKEGLQQKNWIILDYIDVVVHVFMKNTRSFYDLENLWGDAKVTRYE